MNNWSKPTETSLLLIESRRHVSLAANILLFVFLTPLLVRFNLPRLLSLLGKMRGRTPPDPALVQKITHYTDSAVNLCRPLLPTYCLTRGLTLYHFLRRAGLDVSLHFGMGKPKGERFEGHCWLVKDGAPYLESEDPRALFNETYRYPKAPSTSRDV